MQQCMCTMGAITIKGSHSISASVCKTERLRTRCQGPANIRANIQRPCICFRTSVLPCTTLHQESTTAVTEYTLAIHGGMPAAPACRSAPPCSSRRRRRRRAPLPGAGMRPPATWATHAERSPIATRYHCLVAGYMHALGKRCWCKAGSCIGVDAHRLCQHMWKRQSAETRCIICSKGHCHHRIHAGDMAHDLLHFCIRMLVLCVEIMQHSLSRTMRQENVRPFNATKQTKRPLPACVLLLQARVVQPCCWHS